MKWSKISLNKYQHLQLVNSNPGYDELDKLMHTAAIIFNYTDRQFGSLRPKKARKLIGKAARLFLKPLPVRAGKMIGRYVIDYDISNIRFGQYIELNHFIKGDVIDNSGMVVASVAHLPFLKNNSDRHKKVSDYLMGCPAVKVLGSVKEIISQFEKLNLSYSGLFDIVMEKDELNNEKDEIDEIPQMEQGSHGFDGIYGWIYSATVIAEHNRITLDEAYNLPVQQALNDLSYLKAKRQYDEEQVKKQMKAHG